LNPLSRDLDVMRQTLLFGALESIAYNQNRQNSDVRFYEFGSCYFFNPDSSSGNMLDKIHEELHLSVLISGRIGRENWNNERRNATFFDLKGYIDAILSITRAEIPSITIRQFSDTIIETGLSYISGKRNLIAFGKLRKEIVAGFDCKQDVYYAEMNWDFLLEHLPLKDKRFHDLPKSPEVRRDLALVIDQMIPFSALEQIAYETEKKLLKKVSLFDVYEGDKIDHGKKSYALSFILQDDERTLRDDEIDRIMENLVRNYESKLNARLR